MPAELIACSWQLNFCSWSVFPCFDYIVQRLPSLRRGFDSLHPLHYLSMTYGEHTEVSGTLLAPIPRADDIGYGQLVPNREVDSVMSVSELKGRRCVFGFGGLWAVRAAGGSHSLIRAGRRKGTGIQKITGHQGISAFQKRRILSLESLDCASIIVNELIRRSRLCFGGVSCVASFSEQLGGRHGAQRSLCRKLAG
jgi:hypothetical protein